eukprot:EG_transcript_13856
MSCKPNPLVGVQPRDRFFAEFEAEAGSRTGLLPLQPALEILQLLEADWPFSLPPGAREWLQRKMAKYCIAPDAELLTKGRFAQIRNLISDTYEVTELIIQKIAANRHSPPAALPRPAPAPRKPPSASPSSAASTASYDSDELVLPLDVDSQPWDDTSLDVEWVV